MLGIYQGCYFTRIIKTPSSTNWKLSASQLRFLPMTSCVSGKTQVELTKCESAEENCSWVKTTPYL